jgi:transposase-like protein
MSSCRPPLFWKRKFEPEVIITCVRWYLRFCLSLRDLQELMAERGLAVHHTHMAVDSGVRPGNPPAASWRGQAQVIHLAYR